MARRALKVILGSAAVLIFGAVCFFAGTVVGSTSMEVALVVDQDESVEGRLAIYEPSKWDGFEIASAICTTRSEIGNFAHTYAYFGTGLHITFSCLEPGKDT